MITMKRDQLMIEQYRRIRRAQSDQVEVEMEGYVLSSKEAIWSCRR